MLKGFHLAPNFNAALLNQLGCDMWTGTDGILPLVINPLRHSELAELQGEYIHRASDRTGLDHVRGIRQLPQFQDRWILTNEYDLHYPIPEAVNIVTELVTVIPSAYDDPLTPQLYLNMGSNAADTTYIDALWDAFPDEIKARINGFTAHRYRSDTSGINFRHDMRVGSAWMNTHGLHDLKYFCGEFGMDAGQNTQTDAATFMLNVCDAMASEPWLDGLFWFYANMENLNYVTLCNTASGRLTKAGRAWRDADTKGSNVKRKTKRTVGAI